MKRRKFIVATSAVLVATPTLQAQAIARRIGVLGLIKSYGKLTAVFLDGLGSRGWIEGKNLRTEFRWFEEYGSRGERLPILASELVVQKPDVIVTIATPAAMAAHAATNTIPIVFLGVADAVGLGLVKTLSHPGGNVTGLEAFATGGLVGKSIEILKEIVPSASVIAVLVNPTNPSHRARVAEELPGSARTLGLSLPVVEAQTPDEIDAAFSSAVAMHANAICIFPDNLINSQAPRVMALAARHHLPALNSYRDFFRDGLVIYGPDLADQFRRLAEYVDRILRGAKPSDLPVERPTRMEMIINLKTAKTLGLTIPASLLARADEVIE